MKSRSKLVPPLAQTMRNHWGSNVTYRLLLTWAFTFWQWWPQRPKVRGPRGPICDKHEVDVTHKLKHQQELARGQQVPKGPQYQSINMDPISPRSWAPVAKIYDYLKYNLNRVCDNLHVHCGIDATTSTCSYSSLRKHIEVRSNPTMHCNKATLY